MIPLLLIGFLLVIGGTFGILTGFADSFPKNPFLDLLRVSRTKQRANSVVAGAMGLILGIVMIAVAFLGQN